MRDEAIYLWIGASGQRPAVHCGTIGEHTAVIEISAWMFWTRPMPAISRPEQVDRVYFGTRLEDTSNVGFDDEFQYDDFKLPWKERKAIECHPDFEREYALKACQAWASKQDRHPY